jgi:hypothetical protein
VLFVYGIKKNRLDSTEIIIYACVGISYHFAQTLLEMTSFYTFYLYFAACCIAVIASSLFFHVILRVDHSKSVYFVYGLLFFKFFMYMLLYRVRVIVYSSDESIMWLINTQSFLVLLSDFLIVLILALRVSKWKLRFMQFA